MIELLAATALTIQLQNMGKQPADVVFHELSPARGEAQTVRLDPEVAHDTTLPAGTDKIYSIAFRRGGKELARIVATNVAHAFLLEPPGSRPYIVLRPADMREAGDGIMLSGDKRPSGLFCIPGDLRTWNGRRIVVFGNGMLLELAGSLDAVPQKGWQCLCGRALPRQKPDDVLERFEVGSLCPTQPRSQ